MRKKLSIAMFGSRYPVTVKVNSYLDNGNLYVGLFTNDDGYDEPFSDITANTDVKLPPFTAAIKNYSENEGNVDFLLSNGLGKPTGLTIPSGYVELPVFKFDEEKLRSLDPLGCVRYEKSISS